MSNTIPSTHEKSFFSTAMSTFIGSAIEPFVTGQPLYNLTRQLQRYGVTYGNLPTREKIRGIYQALSFHPKTLYNGAGVSSPILGTVTLVQKSADTMISTLFYQQMKRKPTEHEATVLSLLAGLSTGPLLNIMEVMSIAKQSMMIEAKKQNKPFPTYIEVHKKLAIQGVFTSYMKGVVPLMMREGIHTMMLFSGWRPIQKWLSQYNSDEEKMKALSRLVAGLCGAIISHPMDWMQAMKKANMPYTAQEVLRNGFAGLFPRALRCSTFSLIAGTTMEKLEDLFSKMKI